jgi:hypothetical protein
MPDEIKEALTRIAATLPPVVWPEGAELRHRGTVRRRWQVVAVVAAVVVVGVALGGLMVQPGRFPNGVAAGPLVSSACPSGQVPARIELPERNAITLNVYNGTTTPGLAAEVAGELTRRGFVLRRTGDASEIGVGAADQIAVIRYGPTEVGGAWVVRAYFPDALMDFDVQRADDMVDVVLGTQFVALPTVTEVNQNIAINGRAVAPAGTCAGD